MSTLSLTTCRDERRFPDASSLSEDYVMLSDDESMMSVPGCTVPLRGQAAIHVKPG
jgi:hypothetical protein